VLSLIVDNLLSPILLAFGLGIFARLVRSDLEISDSLYSALSIYLLLAIGLKGGVAISETPFQSLVGPICITLLVGVITPLVAFFVLRAILRLSLQDSAGVAAHYGSVSAVTFLAALSFLDAQGQSYEGFLPALMAILEVPGIAVGLLLYQLLQEKGKSLRKAAKEILFGKSLLLLIGGLIIGAISGKEKFTTLEPVFVEPFQGTLFVFLLALGLQCGQRLGDVRRAGPKLIAFATVIPVLHATLGIWLGQLAGLSLGGAMVLGVLSGSASYIAAPAAVRIAIPKASPALYLTCSLAITFPFNIAFGIPLYFKFASWLYS